MEFSSDFFTEAYEQIVMRFKRMAFSNKSQLAFLEDLYLLINDGIPANRAVEMMAQVSTGLSHEVALSIAEKIGEGQPLAEGMSQWFSPNVVEIVRVGETGGALGQTIKSAVNMLSQQGVAIGAFVGAIAYPLSVLIMGCIVIVYLNSSILTQFLMIKPMDQWPDAGKRLVTLGYLIRNWWWVIVVGIIAFILIFRKVLSNFTGDIRDFLDQYPPFSLYRRLVAGRFLETLGLLVSNGVVFKSAIKVMQYQSNTYLRGHLEKMEYLLAMGKVNIADVLDTGLVDYSDLLRLRIMAEVKGFEHGLVRMGLRGTEQATKTLKLIARILGGVLLASGAYLIITIVQGIYLTGMAMGTT